METGKEIIYKYCKKISQIGSEHVDNCEYNLRCFEKGNLNNLCGCPTSYGLDNYKGDCEVEPLLDRTPNEQGKQCDKCWERALRYTY